MLLGQIVRNGVVEAEHHGAVAVWGAAGLQASGGDIGRRFFIRSAAKPFQLHAALSSGADLSDQELAIGASSHGGFPAHLAYVQQILANAGLDESDLQTPADWPLHPEARDLAVRAGASAPRPVFHNCSGKHAVWLATCVAAGWDTASYLEESHPLQVKIRSVMQDVLGADPGPAGIDGCGAPVWRSSVSEMAKAFHRLGNDEQYGRIWNAMHAYPALTSDNGRVDQQVATALDAAAKVGAEGAIGVAVRNSVSIAVKCWDGSARGLQLGMAGTLVALGMEAAARYVQTGTNMDRAVLGGGNPQGELRIAVALEDEE